jgi:ribosomal protein S12 methylthiotransferase accessory factor YcaO
MELTLYNAAEKYLRDVLQERFDPKKLPPITMWEKELAEKTSERQGQYRKYSRIKDNTTSAEKIQRAVRDAQRDDGKEQTRQKSRGVEL